MKKALELQKKAISLAEEIVVEVEKFCEENPEAKPSDFLKVLKKFLKIYEERLRWPEREDEITEYLIMSADFLKLQAQLYQDFVFRSSMNKTSKNSQGGTQ